MFYDRRPYYIVGLGVGVLVAALLYFGPKESPQDRVAAQIALVAREPWDLVRVLSIDFEGSERNPTDVFVHGVRPDGSPVLVQFTAEGPYAATAAIRRLRESPHANREAEILMLPRSLTLLRFRRHFRPDATHVGLAFFAGGVPVSDSTAGNDLAPASASAAADR